MTMRDGKLGHRFQGLVHQPLYEMRNVGSLRAPFSIDQKVRLHRQGPALIRGAAAASPRADAQERRRDQSRSQAAVRDPAQVRTSLYVATHVSRIRPLAWSAIPQMKSAVQLSWNASIAVVPCFPRSGQRRVSWAMTCTFHSAAALEHPRPPRPDRDTRNQPAPRGIGSKRHPTSCLVPSVRIPPVRPGRGPSMCLLPASAIHWNHYISHSGRTGSWHARFPIET